MPHAPSNITLYNAVLYYSVVDYVTVYMCYILLY